MYQIFYLISHNIININKAYLNIEYEKRTKTIIKKELKQFYNFIYILTHISGDL